MHQSSKLHFKALLMELYQSPFSFPIPRTEIMLKV